MPVGIFLFKKVAEKLGVFEINPILFHMKMYLYMTVVRNAVRSYGWGGFNETFMFPPQFHLKKVSQVKLKT